MLMKREAPHLVAEGVTEPGVHSEAAPSPCAVVCRLSTLVRRPHVYKSPFLLSAAICDQKLVI